jgi:Lrp/AsnC family transcriptional regulator for asnA, asnC and gidA
LGHEIDTTDRRIIALLQMDGRMSNVDIARSIGVAEATVRKRIDQLLKEGAIRVVAVPAVDKLGLEVETIIMLKVDLSQVQQISEQLAAMNEVRSVKYATGEYDIIVEAVFPSDEQLLGFLTRRLARIKGIHATATSHVLKSIKEGHDWLLPREGPPLVLVVDDDPDFVETTRIVLESAGYQVASAANGEQGLRAMYRDRPDLVILDVMMNGILDGLDASFRMRAERGVSKTPILMVSSIATSDYAAMFPTDEYVPVENFLSKPVGPDQLLAEVERLLS